MENNMILVEMGGTTKLIPESSLSNLQKTANEMYHLAIVGGFPKEIAEKLFTLRIVKNIE